MNKFEAVVLYSPDLSTSILSREEKVLKKQLSDSDGNIISEEDWGLRDLSYKINKYKKAFYKFYQIEIDGNKLPNIGKILNQNEQIIRHLFVKVEKHEQLPTKMVDSNNVKE